TWTLLATLDQPVSVTVDFGEIFTAITGCCDLVDGEFDATWTIIADLKNSFTRCDLCGVYTILQRNFISIIDTFSIIEEIRATFTTCCEELLNTLTTLVGGCSSTLITQAAVNAAGGQYVINNPGTYSLAEDIVAAGAGSPQSIILINASDVTLNMCGKRIVAVPGNTTSGIIVAPNVRSVTIENGNIEAVQTVGILVSGGVSDLLLDNVATVSCGLIGIFLFGQTGVNPNPISDSSIINCQATNCGWINPLTRGLRGHLLSLESDAPSYDDSVRTVLPSRFVLFQWSGIQLRNCNNITIRNSQFCSNVSQQILGGIFIACSNCVISDCQFNDNVGDTAIGCALIVCSGNTIERCAAMRNRADSSAGAAAGFSIQDSFNTTIADCIANDNSGLEVSGFLLNTNRATSLSGCVAALNRGDGEGFAFFQENGTVIKNCQSLANTSTTLNVDMSGFHSFLGTNNHFEDCSAQKTYADLIAAGYRFTGEQNSSIVNCLAQETLSSFTCAYGIFIETEPNVPT
ncbi:MAG: right-handed parallel beta-helix repeat-containing protein, partial [Cyanobacteria bacterium]|nr:right-handed parallel beta-helix repeat-containing protein [Cyanobacteriota bacterium]